MSAIEKSLINIMEQPLVIILSLVYNHGPYLRQCLDGFVMQKTNFPFYAVVHDDASTDNSAAIIREYAEKYPDIIHPIYETENQYSKGDGSLGRIMNEACKDAKYIALCEGDDYWTDPLKLQKQVDFLEANPDYSMCFHNVNVLSDQKDDESIYSHLETREFSAKEIYEKWTVPTCSILYRNVLPIPNIGKTKIIFGDIFLFLRLSQVGKLYCIADKMGVYRRHNGGVSFSINAEKAIALIRQYEFMAEYFKNDSDIVTMSRKYVQEFCGALHYYLPDTTKIQRLRYLPTLQRCRKNKMFSYSTLSYIYTYIIKR